ncbi:hypothetical protein COX18_10405 [Candidatus Desantisbacteria bacterium CG23_combo_of_CG06-09_8_20_14_all_40_23]|uniref:Uncharacterized protein n=1 Tax=Candidatus Desantisbacteria bacterium CG23_combo_of_CG06-09_8_20_14_all_40_23 TaxID=1974550 RepID=A0A2H0A1N4_9BACT|nr:MAG: hypothetical protein COX18_10405 [Candidatus Desantisbacteria bacterium CG23_combo_of_CG06-09_8_20_14_all_40_23]
MNYKGIIVAGVIAIGLYLFSQQKKTAHKTPDFAPFKKMAEKMAAERLPSNASLTAKKEFAEKIYADIMARRAAATKKIAQKKVVRTGMALKIYNIKKAIAAAQALRLSTMAPGAVLPPLIAKAIQKRVVRKAAAQKIGKKIGKTVAQNIAQKIKTRRAVMARYAMRQRPQIQRPNPNKKRVVSWKAPYRFPTKKFRVITPSDLLKNLVKKGIARKKAVQQKKVQKTTQTTPSARRKKRLEALYGSHWHQVWIERLRRR